MFLSFRTFSIIFILLFVFIIIISLFYLVICYIYSCAIVFIFILLLFSSQRRILYHLNIHFCSSLFHILIRPGRMMRKENGRPSLSPTIVRRSVQSPIGWWNGKDVCSSFSLSSSSPSANINARLFFRVLLFSINEECFGYPFFSCSLQRCSKTQCIWGTCPFDVCEAW